MARLIGTAGHVDHGKTTLIRALTGIDADRLPEEKKRGMTIDIGFAYLDLPRAGRVSIVDVPGHEKFLTNMLVGALGIDVALLCVAADESVMPQTREHLQILELLPVDRLIVALTRADLADSEMREFVRLEVAELLETTRFGSAPVYDVSAFTGEGIEELKSVLDEELANPKPADDRPWYMPVDRVFTVKGHGAVVTGTLAQGKVRPGDEVEIGPEGLRARVRSVHSHEESLEQSERGRRTALNLGGVDAEDLRRGQLAGKPGTVFATRVLDARVRRVAPMRHAMRVRVSIGAEEAIGKAFLNESDPDVIQLRLEHEVACALDQPLIVRRYSPPDVLAGGRVAVPVAAVRRKSEAARLVATEATDEEAILQALAGNEEGLSTEEIARMAGRSAQALSPAFASLSGVGMVLGFAGLWIGAAEFERATARIVASLEALHAERPTQRLHTREAVFERAGLPWAGKSLDRIVHALSERGLVAYSGGGLRLASFAVKLNSKQEEFLQRVESEMTGLAQSPSVEELCRALHVPPQAVEEILRLGVEAGRIVRIAESLFFSQDRLSELRKDMAQRYGNRPFTAAEFRDEYGSSRKFVIPLLEHFDAIGFTVRTGDQRIVRPSGAA